MKNTIFLIIVTLATSCRSEPLPSSNTNAVISFTYFANGGDSTGWKVDELAPAYTNNWQLSVNWQPVCTGPILAGVTNYSTTNFVLPGSLVTAWATNAAGIQSLPATPVSYTPNPIKFTAPTVTVQ